MSETRTPSEAPAPPNGTAGAAAADFDTSPIHRSVTVARSQADAFELFTDGISSWWPVSTHAIEEDAREVIFESRIGGRIFERTPQGIESDWGRVLTWEPPQRVVYAWQPNRDRPNPTEIEVRFVAEADDRTRVELEHRGWDRIGEIARVGRPQYDSSNGWTMVLGAYAREAEAS